MCEKLKPKLAISQCLVGDNVRYDGRTKPHDFVIDHLSLKFDPTVICPEVEIGMTVPRKPIQLIIKNNSVHSVEVDDSLIDYTEPLRNHASKMREKIADVSGYVFKARSPSCGVGTTPVVDAGFNASGVFAEAVLNQHSVLPIIDEAVLDDHNLRDQFLENVFCYVAFLMNTKRVDAREKFIHAYGLRWVLRTGMNIKVLENVLADDFDALFFCSMNKLLDSDERKTRVSEAVNNNTVLFNNLGGEFLLVVERYLTDSISFFQLTRYLDELLRKKTTNDYHLEISEDEKYLRTVSV